MQRGAPAVALALVKNVRGLSIGNSMKSFSTRGPSMRVGMDQKWNGPIGVYSYLASELHFSTDFYRFLQTSTDFYLAL